MQVDLNTAFDKKFVRNGTEFHLQVVARGPWLIEDGATSPWLFKLSL